MGIVKHLFIGSLLMMAFSSCKKSGEDLPAEPQCKIATFVDVQTGTTYKYVYTGSRITSIEFPGGRYTIDYDGERPVRRNVFVAGAVTPNEKQEIVYKSDGMLEMIEFHELINQQTGLYNKYGEYVFTNFNGMPSHLMIYSIDQGVSTLEEEYSYSTFQGNIISCNARDYLPTVQNVDFEYIYDHSPNFFKQANPTTFLTDLIFIELNPVLLPMAVSKTNVTNILLGSSVTYFRYFLNDKGLLSSFSLNGGAGYAYSYLCQ